jgi:predicted secreted hydrolase
MICRQSSPAEVAAPGETVNARSDIRAERIDADERVTLGRETPDLAPNFSSPLEWWYAQGRLYEEGGREHHLMFSLYRVRRGDGEASMVLVSLADVAARRHATANVVSHSFLAAFLDIARRVGTQIAPAPVVSFGVDLFADMVSDGAWTGFSLRSDAAAFDHTLDIEWAGVELRQHGMLISLGFAATHDLPKVELTLNPLTLWSSVEASHLPEHSLDGYRSCPRLSAEGHVDGRPVRGEVWFEQQWGMLGQTIVEENGRLRLVGWNWFAVNFDDGNDLLLYQRRDMASGEVVDDFAVFFEEGLWRLVRGEFMTKSDAIRKAPKSGISFPRHWRLESAQLDLVLDVEAEHEMAEVSILGPFHTLWEGSARVSGKQGGRIVGGRAWVELYGWDHPLGLGSHLRFWRAALKSLAKRHGITS